MVLVALFLFLGGIFLVKLSYNEYLELKDAPLYFEPLVDFVGFGLLPKIITPTEFADGNSLKDCYEIGNWYLVDGSQTKADCKWYAEYEGVCCNGDCPLVADFVSDDKECLVCKYKEVETG